MPMVSESYSSPSIVVPTSRAGSVTNTVVPGSVSKTQTGYRSRSLTPVEERGISEGDHTAADTLSLLSAYEEAGYEYLSHKERAFVVNDRDAEKTTRQHGTFKSDTRFRNSSDQYRYQISGVIALTGFQVGMIPAWPSPSVLSSRASQMMRRSIPTKAEINLTRSVGELRQAPMMFRAANYRPRNPKELGGAYLNYVFGIAPTVSDLSAAADAVVSFDAVLQSYIAQEKIRTRRKREIELWSGTGAGVSTVKDPNFDLNSKPYNVGPLKVLASYVVPASGFADVLRPHLSWSWGCSQVLRMFSTFEYFVPKPEGLSGRLERARQLATRIVGGGLDASTVYDLTPWTWLGNYFVDVGGLLRYQQSVADHQVVATSSGYSVYEDLRMKVSYTNRFYDPSGVVGAWPVYSDRLTPSVTTYRRKKHRRRAGGPFDIAPDWDFDPQQWAILGALGLARGPGVPIKR